MKKFKVTIDGDVIAKDATGWYISGSYLCLNFQDGSVQGHTGFVEFLIQVQGEE